MPEKLVLGPRVLIVSNQQITGPLWVFSLQQQDQHVMLEADPSKTLQRCEMETPDLIILDISLPETKTIDLTKSLRVEMTTPILLLTPPRSEENIIDAYKAVVDDYMLKPVSLSLFNARSK